MLELAIHVERLSLSSLKVIGTKYRKVWWVVESPSGFAFCGKGTGRDLMGERVRGRFAESGPISFRCPQTIILYVKGAFVKGTFFWQRWHMKPIDECLQKN